MSESSRTGYWCERGDHPTSPERSELVYDRDQTGAAPASFVACHFHLTEREKELVAEQPPGGLQQPPRWAIEQAADEFDEPRPLWVAVAVRALQIVDDDEQQADRETDS